MTSSARCHFIAHESLGPHAFRTRPASGRRNRSLWNCIHAGYGRGHPRLVRRIATELRPQVLDKLGLAAAVKWQAAKNSNRRTGIACRVLLPEASVKADTERSTALLRGFLQAALTSRGTPGRRRWWWSFARMDRAEEM